MSESKEGTVVQQGGIGTPGTPCQRLGHHFTQQRDAFGGWSIWLYCRRCGKQHKLGSVAER